MSKCSRCSHLDHSSEWCSVDVITGSSTQEMCGCPPTSGEPSTEHEEKPCRGCYEDGYRRGKRDAEAEAEARATPPALDEEREALIEVVSEHPRWTEENQCNLCPGDEPYEEHIAPLLARLKGAPSPAGSPKPIQQKQQRLKK